MMRDDRLIATDHQQSQTETLELGHGCAGADGMAFSGPIGGDRTANSGPLISKKFTKKSARFNIPNDPFSSATSSVTSSVVGEDDDAYVEITLDVCDDSIAVHSVKSAGALTGEGKEQAGTLLARTLEKKPSFGASIVRSTSNRIRQVSRELLKLASVNRSPREIDRSKSAAAHALKGLKFISKTDGDKGWEAVAKGFDELAVNGSLPKKLFGQCIGMKESNEFAGELFDALARRRNITSNSITKDELKDFWEQLLDQSFDSRLQIFFNM